MRDLPRGSGLIFVGGAPRSGTTLLQRVLNAHPSIFGGPEFDLVPEIVEWKRGVEQRARSGRIDAFLSEEDVARCFGALIEDLLSVRRQRQGTAFLSEKTPGNVLVFDELMDLLPGARFVVCVRDPRAIVSSMLEVGRRYRRRTGKRPRNFTCDVVSAVEHLNACFAAGAKAVSRGAHLCIYEELVLGPEAATKVLFEYLGVNGQVGAAELRSSRFEPARDQASWRDWYRAEELESGIDPSRLEKWRAALGSRERAYVEDRATLPASLASRYIGIHGRRVGRHRWVQLEHLRNETSATAVDLSKQLKRASRRLRRAALGRAVAR